MEKYSFIKWIKPGFLSLSVDNSSSEIVHVFYFDQEQDFPQNSPHFVQIIYNFQGEGKHCIVTPFDVGISLSQLFSSNNTFFHEKHLTLIFYQICLDISSFHQLSLKYNHLNMSNIFLNEKGSVILHIIEPRFQYIAASSILNLKEEIIE
jgi:serine/threonine protein kinase